MRLCESLAEAEQFENLALSHFSAKLLNTEAKEHGEAREEEQRGEAKHLSA
jgi:hypothetical protein